MKNVDMKTALQNAQAAVNLAHSFNPNIPGRNAQRNFSNGGKHKWGEKTHAYRSGRGMFGGHWECTNNNCRYYDQASLYDTIAKFPACCSKCTECGDWSYNCRQTCPNAKQEEEKSVNYGDVFKTGMTNLTSWHGTRIRATPQGNVDLTENNETWQRWQWIWLGADKFLWVSCHGTFLRAHPNGYVDCSQKANAWEIWTKEFHGDHHAWRSCHGTYLRAGQDNVVNLASERREWELWRD